MFESKEKFTNYAQFILIAFGIIWIILLFYIAYEAPSYSSEADGVVYPVTYKGKTVYLTLTQEILICGSTIGFALSFVMLQMFTSYYWKADE